MSDPNSTIKHIRLALMYSIMEGPVLLRLIVVHSVVDATNARKKRLSMVDGGQLVSS
jgi:cytochrome c oxidase subunit IV